MVPNKLQDRVAVARQTRRGDGKGTFLHCQSATLTGICEVPAYAKNLAYLADVAVDCVAHQCAGCVRDPHKHSRSIGILSITGRRHHAG